ncbi:MAG TPA: outer membrane beta-barrel protein [Rhizomicrobium sp.]|nr:outer membrane beta-barrel protein [Rhizomicrobium sp.]
MHFKFALPLAAATLLLSSAAALADGEMTSGWGGFYAGAIADVNFGSSHFALPNDPNDVLQQTHSDHTSFAGGGLLGFNWQDGDMVYGLEADLTSGNGTSSVTACTKIDGCFTSAHDSFTTLNHLKTDLSGRVRARIGWTSGDTLFYAAGGYSYADTKLSLVGLCFNAANPTVPLVFNFARSKTLSGYNLGVGMEKPLGDGFIIRAEYVFEDFGSTTYKGQAPEWNDRSISVRNSALRVAVAYHF